MFPSGIIAIARAETNHVAEESTNLVSTAPETYNAQQEIEFARQKLQSDLPNRLQQLLDIFSSSQTERWFFSLISKLILAVRRACSDVYKTIDQDALSAAAWTARNVLELWVWLKYCAASRENARRYYEDAIRDMEGLVESLSKLHSLRGIPNSFENPARLGLAQVTQKQFGVDTLGLSYTRVAQAANAVGVGQEFTANNQFLSKFAHPTAGLVLGIMHQTEQLRELQVSITTQGLYFAGRCVIVLGEIIEALPSRTLKDGRIP